MAVDSIHPEYGNMVDIWQTMSDLCSCERVVHLSGERYLSRLSDQDDSQYEAYVNRAAMVAFTKRCVEAFHGMVMRKDVHVDGYKSNNVDGKGSTINTYVGELVRDFLKYRRSGTLVDMPTVKVPISVADAVEKNIFPRMAYYSFADIINWKMSVINNISVLSLVVLREVEDASEDEFGHDIRYRYRVLDLVDGFYRQRQYDHSLQQVGGDLYPLKDSQKIPFIPFVIHGGVKVDYPSLLPIAEQNIHHYMLDADYKHGLHFVALPTPWVTGVDEKNKPTSIGPTKLWAFEDPDVRCGMLEFTGAGLAQINIAMENTVKTILTLASRVIAPEKSSNDESALASSIRSNSETSSLSSIVDMLSSEMTNIVRMIVWWSGGNPEKVNVFINKDFMPSNMSGTDVLAYITAWIKGGISYESLFHLLKKGEVVKGDRIKDDEFKDITEEQKKRMAQEVDDAVKPNEGDPKDPNKELKIDDRVS